MKKKILIFLFFSGIVTIGSMLLSQDIPSAQKGEKGVFSIKQFSEQEMVKLNGEWEFFWLKLYKPKDIERLGTQPISHFVEAPRAWNHYNIDGEDLPITGYATYRLKVYFPKHETGSTKALYIPNISSAYTLWIDGIEKVKSGVVGKDKNSMVFADEPKVAEFEVRSEPIELIFQVSNFNQRRAGMFDPILLGNPEVISEYRDKKILYRAVVVVSLFTMGIYHLILYSFRNKEYSLIFFGLVCLLTAVRSTLLEQGLAAYILPFLNWEVAMKLEYLGASLAIMFFSWFTYTQFSEDMHRKVKTSIVIVMSLYSLFIILTPGIIFTRTMLVLQIIIMMIFVYLLTVYFKAYIHKRDGALLNAFGILVIFLAVINDFLYFSQFVKTTELSSVGLMFFLFTQSIMISRRYSRSFVEIEQISKNLATLNMSLEQQVHDRTIELQHTNEELEVTNEILNIAHQSRSKWIRNISHEIGTPLTSIRSYTTAMLEGVIHMDKKYIQLVYDQSLYLSRMLNDLHDMTEVENRQIKFDMKKVNIRDYMQEFYDKYRMTLEREGITFLLRNFPASQDNEPLVLMDRTRIEQVIVNLLTNAQRFVKEDGEIILEVCKNEDNYIVIKVKDNGAGIKEEERHLVFKRFYRSGNQGKLHDGSGLGLAISKEIVEYHNGEISVKSEVGEGSTFYFSLPIVE